MQISNITNAPNEQKYKNKGLIQGLCARKIALLPASVIVGKIASKNVVISQTAGQDSIIIEKAAQRGLKESGLFDKGIRIHTVSETYPVTKFKKDLKAIYEKLLKKEETPENAMEAIKKLFNNMLNTSKKNETAVSAIKEAFEKDKMISTLAKSKSIKETGINLTDFLARIRSLKYAEGANAGFFEKAKAIITPEKSFRLSVFHEMGHALNATGGKVLKTLNKSTVISKYAPGAILLTSLLCKKRLNNDNSDKKQNMLEKLQFGIKKHAGLLTGLAFVPMILDEGIASIRGKGIAKKLLEEGHLTKDLYKRINKSNIYGFVTYALFSAFSVLAVKTAIKTKDTVQQNYENKKLQIKK